MKENLVLEKSKNFALRIIKLHLHLKDNKQEYIIGNQILRSGTSIGANIAESDYAESRLDFINKLHIAIKEASETAYWLELVHRSNYISESEFMSINDDVKEILRLLASSIKTAKK